MAGTLTIQADPRAQASLDTLLARMQSELGHGAEEATRWAAYYILQSLAASTRKAPAKLPFRAAKPGTPVAAKFAGYVLRYSGGKQRRRYVPIGADIDKARRNPRAGLAKQSWLWAIGDLGLRGGGTSRLKRPADAMTATSTAGLNPEVRIENRLSYILAAVRHGGRRGIDTALDRGITAGMRYLDRRARRAAS